MFKKKKLEEKKDIPEAQVENVSISTGVEPVKEVSPEEHMAFLVETVSGMTDSEYKAQVISILLEILEVQNGKRG